MSSAVSIEDLDKFFFKVFPADEQAERTFMVVERNHVIIRLDSSPRLLRPGGMFSGPTQMSLADICAYAAIFTRLGIMPMAVTSSLNISFLRPCIGHAIEADARLVKCGRSLVVLEVDIRAVDVEKPASRAMITYVLPS